MKQSYRFEISNITINLRITTCLNQITDLYACYFLFHALIVYFYIDIKQFSSDIGVFII